MLNIYVPPMYSDQGEPVPAGRSGEERRTNCTAPSRTPPPVALLLVDVISPGDFPDTDDFLHHAHTSMVGVIPPSRLLKGVFGCARVIPDSPLRVFLLSGRHLGC